MFFLDNYNSCGRVRALREIIASLNALRAKIEAQLMHARSLGKYSDISSLELYLSKVIADIKLKSAELETVLGKQAPNEHSCNY